MSTATTMRPSRGIGLGNGWLSMAPQTDDCPIISQPVAILDEQRDSTQASPSRPSSIEHSPILPPHRSTHGGLQPQPSSSSSPMMTGTINRNNNKINSSSSSSSQFKPSAVPKRFLPRTNARFSVGDSTSQPATPTSPFLESPSLSHGSGDGDDSPPPFDVRNSFAPMQWNKVVSTDEQQIINNDHHRRNSSSLRRGSNAETENKSGKRLLQGQQKGVSDISFPNNEDEDEESDGERVEYAGRKWKGKTANAIEQEMEALGDRTVMSYAPDAVYLASRLEGLRRNLEAGGVRFRRWAWEEFEETGSDGEKADESEHIVQSTTENEKAPDAETRRSSQEITASPRTRDLRSPIASISTHASPSRSALITSSLLSPVQEVPVDPMLVDESIQKEQEKLTFSSIAHENAKGIDRAAKEAALDARLEIRTLRRPDLEQVRELHCYHGDGDKVDTDTYTTSAAFLLRLLVDEHYVCLVAVAKPLPEPPALPTTMSPRPPPPSLDMPATRAPVLMAGRTSGLNSRQGRFPLLTNGQRLIPTNSISNTLIDATPAPRSFGAGPDSETNPSSSEGGNDERMGTDDDLFEGSNNVASTYTTEDTSPPMNEDNGSSVGVPMDVVMEEEDEDHHELTASESNSHHHKNAPFTGSSSPRTEIAAANAASRSRKPSSSAATTTSKADVLAGPTFDVAPPRAIRIMGAPPLGGMPIESETILGVVSARIKVVQRAANEFGNHEQTQSMDSSWPGLDPKGERSIVTREAHIMTLSVLPGERGQGLGARLLDLLIEECKRRTAGPRIHLASGSNTIEEQAMSSAPARVHQDAPMRTVLEVHPSNQAAMSLYKNRQFNQVSGNKGIVKHFYRGDQRIPGSVRLRVGGSDAVRLERMDVPPSSSSSS